jgi:hypothetical protein
MRCPGPRRIHSWPGRLFCRRGTTEEVKGKEEMDRLAVKTPATLTTTRTSTASTVRAPEGILSFLVFTRYRMPWVSQFGLNTAA